MTGLRTSMRYHTALLAWPGCPAAVPDFVLQIICSAVAMPYQGESTWWNPSNVRPSFSTTS